jgi:hypothetical protein
MRTKARFYFKTLPYIVPQGIESFYHQSGFGGTQNDIGFLSEGLERKKIMIGQYKL